MMKRHEDRRYEIAWWECDICGAMTDDYHPDDLPTVTECPDQTYCTESGTIRPGTLVGLAFALVPITLLLTFSARLAGMLAGTVGAVA